MREFVLFFVNGKEHRVGDARAFESLSRFLRSDERQTGTKIVCEEGDCGACTVLIGRPENGTIAYRPVNSCIQFLYQLDCTHVVTIEGVCGEQMSPVQDAMIRCHGAQCGYCTPGFVVAMTAIHESGDNLTEQRIRDGLTGNLCRCTGYEPIIKAALGVEPGAGPSLEEIYPSGPMIDSFARVANEPVTVEIEGRLFHRPTDLASAARFRDNHEGVVIVQGGTDVGVLCNKRGFSPDTVMTLDGIDGLDELRVDDGVMIVGGRVTLSVLEAFVKDRLPQLHDMLILFGSPQIRNSGTLSGNIANGSPIADTLPFLFVMEATIEVTGVGGTRPVEINSFYKGYKTLDLEPDEIITRIFIPLPSENDILRLYKVSKRKHLDISSFTAAMLMIRSNGSIASIRIAYGGVGPVVLRLPKTEAFLSGRTFALDSFEEAGEIARGEITPISDVRGSAEFRSQLAENILTKFYYEVEAAG